MANSPIPKELREQILARIKNDGIPAAQAAREHGVNVKTVYGWIERTTTKEPGILELSRVRRENQGLYELLGRLTSEVEKLKKNQGGSNHGK
jgi:transposase-like protein